MRDFFEGKVVVISGGTEGIGRSLVHILSAWNAKISVCARTKEKVDVYREHFAQIPDVYYAYCDVRDRADCKLFIQNTVQRFSRIDILINNAGISMRSEFARSDLSITENILQTNFLGSVYLTHYCLPYLLATHGVLVGISSVAGMRATPGRSAYSASKFALTGFLESLRVELRGKVRVLTVFPGFVSSQIREKALSGDGNTVKNSTMQEKKLMSADTCALHILRAIQRKKNRLTLTLLGKITVCLHRLYPPLADFLVHRFYYKNGKLAK